MAIPDATFMLAADSDIDDEELEQVVRKIKRKMEERLESKSNLSNNKRQTRKKKSDSEDSDNEPKHDSSRRKRKKIQVDATDSKFVIKKTKEPEWATGSKNGDCDNLAVISPELQDDDIPCFNTVFNFKDARKPKKTLDRRLERLLRRKKKDILSMLNRKSNERHSGGTIQNKTKNSSNITCKMCSSSVVETKISRNNEATREEKFDHCLEKMSNGLVSYNPKRTHVVIGTANSDSGIDMNNTEDICIGVKGRNSDLLEDKGGLCEACLHGTTINTSESVGLQDIPSEDQYVAMDCEFVGVGPKKSNALGRVSIVDFRGDVVYDVYCRPDVAITDYRTRWSGIRPSNMRQAIPFKTVQKCVNNIIQDKYVIGHAIFNDFRVLGIKHPGHRIRDTHNYKALREMASYQTNCSCSLKKLSWALLDRRIQTGEHCSVEDARATLDLYKLVRLEWEQKILRRVTKRSKVKVVESDVADMEEHFLDDEYWPTELFSDQENVVKK